jgi:hypothetical protein
METKIMKRTSLQVLGGIMIAVIALILFVQSASAATPIYVRPGGDDTLCDGTADVDYSAGVGTACAVQTIHQGIALVDSGGTVNVAAGTYAEYVAINKDLTLSGETGAIIQKPSGDVYYKLPDEGTTKSFRPIVFAYGGSITDGDGTTAATAYTVQGTGTVNVTVSGFNINGNNAWTGANSSNYADAILFRNVVGTITANSIDDMLPADTNQFTLAIEVRGDNSVVTISDNTLTEFGRTGMLIAGYLGTPVATITGNTVTAVDFGAYVKNGIEVNYRSTGTVSNNTVTNATGEGTPWTGGGIMVYASDNVTISGNNVSDCDVGVSVGGRANYGYVANNNIVEGNTLANNLYSSIEVNTNSQNTTVRNNTITGVAARADTAEAGIVIMEYSEPTSGYPDGVLIEGNNISGEPGFWGIDIYRNADNVTIQNNTVTGGAVAVALELKETNSVGKNITIGGATDKANSFSGQTVLAVSTGPYDYSSVVYQWTPDVNASANWWGDSTPAGIAALVSANVDYTPWLASGTDTSTDPGFQGDFSSLWVDDDSPQTSTTGRIQEGVDLVSGSTINVAAGTYTQTVNIEGKTGLTLDGEDKATVILQPTSTLCTNVSTWGCGRTTAFRVVSSTGILLQDMTFDFSIIKGNNVLGLLLWDSTATVNNNILKNMSAPDASGFYYEITSYVRAPSYTDATRAQVAFTGNTFIDTGRLGIVTHDFVHTTISGNTFHKDVDDFGYAMEIGSESTAIISNNIIDGYDTPAASDGSNSAGIYIENAFTYDNTSVITKPVSVTDNEIYDCQSALYIGNEFDGYAGPVDVVVTATGNNFHDNIDGAVVITDEDKEDGSSVNFTGSTNTLTDNGDFGYFIYTWGDGDVTVSLDGETISGNDIGVYLNDYAATPPSGSSYDVEIHGSSIAGNTSYGVQNEYADTTIDAELNWWGCPCGPSGEGPGSGDAVSPYVSFSPWYADAAMTTTAAGEAGAITFLAGSTTDTMNAIIACAAPGTTLTFESGAYPGGLLVGAGKSDLTFDLNGTTVNNGSPAFTIDGDDITIQGPGILSGDSTSPGILVNAGANNFILDGVQVTNWLDGVQVSGAVESLKIVNNWIHSNSDDGLQVDAAPSGVVTIEGNLFKVNTGVGVEYNGTGSLDATYNSWGDVAGPTGLGTNVIYYPWTFSEIYFDLDPGTTGDQFTRRVAETDVFDVAIMGDAENLYGLSFKFSFDSTRLALNSTTFSAPWTDKCTLLKDLESDEVGYLCNLTSDPEWDGGKIATFNFTATNSGDASFDVFSDTSLSSAAKGGVKVFVNNAGYNDPSTADRLVTDTNDGLLVIDDIANFTGFIDLQGRANDAGALLAVYNADTGGTLLATATSLSSGKYTTVYEAGQLLVVSTDDPLYSVPYYLFVDRALYLPSLNPFVTAQLYSSPTTSLYQLLLLGGDSTDNNTIDIADAACIGADYGDSSNTCSGEAGANSDVNGDGVVNIYDLTLMGGNYGLSTSSWSPQ